MTCVKMFLVSDVGINVREINSIPGCSQSDQALKLYFINVVGIYIFPSLVLREKMP